jgi:CheY-like chemotaxis protein
MLNSAPKALLVDDDQASFQDTRQRLEGEGYSVDLARDAADGLSRARQSAPAVIFTHLVAGSSAGSLAFIQALRSDDACRHIPVVVLGGRPNVLTGQKKLRAVSRDRW